MNSWRLPERVSRWIRVTFRPGTPLTRVQVPVSGAGLSVVVEGVETEQQRVLLRLAGCDEMQGFLFAKPAPAKAIDELLRQGKDARPVEALTA